MQQNNKYTNDEVHKRLSDIVINEFFKDFLINKSKIKIGQLEINDYSICFQISADSRNKKKAVYVKIPKRHIHKEKVKNIMPLSQYDIVFANDEYHSLQEMEKKWNSKDAKIIFIKPLGFINEFNAIVTEQFHGEDIFKKFRQFDLSGKFFLGKQKDAFHEIMKEIGVTLAQYHKRTQGQSDYVLDDDVVKIRKYNDVLKKFGCPGKTILEINRTLNSRFGQNRFFVPVKSVGIFKGFDIRNILINKHTNQVCFLDPGKIKIKVPETDLARFILTCRILYWGSLLFFLKLSPNKRYEQSFLEGYNRINPINNKRLRLFILKEYMKHWVMANRVLKLKSWPKFFKTIIKYLYIDSYYKNCIHKELALLKGL